MNSADIQLLTKAPYKFNIYDESNFKELMWAIDKCLLNTKNKTRNLYIVYNGKSAECNIGEIAYGKSEEGSIQESIVSAVVCMLLDPSVENDEDVATFKHMMSIMDWKH